MPSELTTASFRDYRPADREWVTEANVHHYERVEGFDPSFAKAVSTALDLLEEKLNEDTSKFLIVEAGEMRHPVGCVFFSAENSASGRLRLFYLEEPYRGLRIGTRMIGELIEHSMDQGFEMILVSTFDRHDAACCLYKKLGFREQAREPAIAFGQKMRQIDFEKTLSNHSR
jgi:GNAT superfamily N-acetyltransferase